MVEAEDGGLFRSDDAGATWTAINRERRLWQRAFYFIRMTADPADRDTLYVLNFELLKSTDGGRTFNPMAETHSDPHDLWIAPDDPRRMINSNDGGASVSTNGGLTWTEQTYATAQFYNAVTTAAAPYDVCGAQQDNSTACVSSRGRGESLYAVDRTNALRQRVAGISGRSGAARSQGALPMDVPHRLFAGRAEGALHQLAASVPHYE
jgi:photosystem II stability/assembly factor-like uncharacterized protein